MSVLLSPRVLLKGLAFIAVLVLLGFLVEQGGWLDETWIDSAVRGKGLAGEVLFVGVAALATALGLPRQLVSFLGGYAFGLLTGGALALAATVLGCALAFYYARLLGRRMLRYGAPARGRVRKLNAFVSDNPLTMTLLIRLLPIGSNLAVNLAAGLSSVRATSFLAGSALGYLPQTLVFALLGSGIKVEPGLRVGLAVALFVLSGLLGAHLYRRYRRGRSLDEELESDLA